MPEEECQTRGREIESGTMSTLVTGVGIGGVGGGGRREEGV